MKKNPNKKKKLTYYILKNITIGPHPKKKKKKNPQW